MGSESVARVVNCELLVVGSGVAGMCAALQAARLGVATVLLEKESVLGGNSGPQLGIHWGGAHIYHDYAAETGICLELEEEIAYRGGKTRTSGFHYNINRLMEALWVEKLQAAGVTILKRHLAREAVTDGRRVVAVIATDTALLETVRVAVSHAVVDASGDGQVAYAAGASYRLGREGQEEFGERSAPEVADSQVAGVSMTALVHDAGCETPFIPPAAAFEVRLNAEPGPWTSALPLRFLWVTETGGTQLCPLRDEHEIYEILLKQFYQWWAKTKQQPAAANWELVWVSPLCGKRETRRFEGEVMLTQTDLEQPAPMPDRLGYGGFTIDQHEQCADGVNRIYMYSSPPLYDLPYRMTYSKDFDNLYLAGRLISSTHLAHGSTRIIKTGGLLAQGTAVAVAVAKRHHCSAHEVYEQHLEELQQEFLRQDGSLINLPAKDPRDLAREAVVTASSQWRYEDFEISEQVELTGKRGVMLYDWPRHIGCVCLHVTNATEDKQPLRAQVFYANEQPPELKPRPAEEEGGFFYHLFAVEKQVSQLREASRVTVMAPPGFAGWLSCPLPSRLRLLGRNRRYRHQGLALVVEGRKLQLGYDPRPCEVAQTVVVDKGGLQLSEGRLAIKPDETVPLGEAVQVINGVARRFGRAPLNMWVSAPGESLPQWLELRLPQAAELARVALTFDGLGQHYTDQPFNNGQRVFGPMVSDYQILVEREGQWEELVAVSNNYHRFVVHEFDPVTVTAVRLVVTGVYEPRWGARVAEIRLEGRP